MKAKAPKAEVCKFLRTDPSRSQWGFCGLGDKDFPIGRDLLASMSEKPGFVHALSESWKNTHNEICNSDGLEIPEKAVKSVCGEFCLKSSWPEGDSNFSLLYKSSLGLLKNVCRSMKPLYS